MKRRIEELLNDTYIYQAPKLVLSATRLELTALKDSGTEGEFFFSAEDNRRIQGTLVSSNRRIIMKRDSFAGSGIHVHFYVDTRGLFEGESVKGRITVLSSVGEAFVDIEAIIEEKQIQSLHGEIKNLDGFAKLAQMDFRDAFHMYTSGDFTRLFKGKDACWLPVYRGLCANPVGYQHLEEFLIACGRKEQILISLDRESKVYEGIRGSQKNILYIEKSSWGYLRMEIEVTGDFLQVDKKVITSDDFIGSLYGLEYIIRRDRLRPGRNYGKIKVKTLYETKTFFVMASFGSHASQASREEKKKKLTLLKEYLLYDAGAIGEKEWKEHTLELVKDKEGEKDYLSCLYLTALHLAADSSADAIAACWPVKNDEVRTDSPALTGLGLYLMRECGLSDLTAEELKSHIYDLRMQAPMDVLLLCIWHELSQDIPPLKKLQAYERLWDYGSRSPLLYSACYKLIKADPTLLTSLQGLQLAGLQFIVKRGMLSPELSAKLAILAQHAKGFSKAVFALLCRAYDIRPDKELLEAILKQIMLESPGRPSYFIWYERAVRAQIRVTRLYEYYLETMPMPHEEILPKAIRLYFSYENRLRMTEKAFLYANIIGNREKDPKTYEKYLPQMESFTYEALKKGLISEYYAILYRHFIDKAEDESMAAALSSVMFTHLVTVNNSDIRQVVVLSPYLSQEIRYPVKNRAAYINLYTGDEQLLFEDSTKHRFAATVKFKLTPLLKASDYEDSCREKGEMSFGLLLHTMLPEFEYKDVSQDNINTFLRIAEDDRIREEYRVTARTKALQYYTRHEEEDMPESMERLMSREDFAGKLKGLIVRAMLQRHKAAGAFDVISRYGFEHIEQRTLVTLCSKLIEKMQGKENEEVIALAYELFERGKANEIILTYLCEHFIGSLEEMVSLRTLLADKELDTKGIDEELLILSMYLRKPLKHPGEILENYMQGNPRKEIWQAFLIFQAYQWFCAGESQESYIAEKLIDMAREGQGGNIVRLAVLNYFAALSAGDDDSVVYGWKDKEKETVCEDPKPDMELIRSLVAELDSQGIRMGFYKKLPQEILQAFDLEDKTFVEYQGAKGQPMTISYRLLAEGEKEGRLKVKPVREVFQGIYVKEFMLFYGERIEYAFSPEKGPEAKDFKLLTQDAAGKEGKSKYQSINEMLGLLHVQDYDKLDTCMQSFLETEHLIKEICTLL